MVVLEKAQGNGRHNWLGAGAQGSSHLSSSMNVAHDVTVGW